MSIMAGEIGAVLWTDLMAGCAGQTHIQFEVFLGAGDGGDGLVIALGDIDADGLRLLPGSTLGTGLLSRTKYLSGIPPFCSQNHPVMTITVLLTRRAVE